MLLTKVGHGATRLFFACLLIASVAGGCTATFVSSYDEQLDKAASEVQKKADSLLAKMQDPGSPARRYSVSKPAYDDVLTDLRAMKVRAQANNQNNLNRHTIDQLGLLEDSVLTLQKTHEKKPTGLSVDAVRTAQDIIDAHIGAIIKFELAKKRGDAKI